MMLSYIICVRQLDHAVVNVVAERSIMLVHPVGVRAGKYVHTVKGRAGLS